MNLIDIFYFSCQANRIKANKTKTSLLQISALLLLLLLLLLFLLPLLLLLLLFHNKNEIGLSQVIFTNRLFTLKDS